MFNKLNSFAAAGALVVAACLVPPRTEAQGIARRISAVRDGKVRMAFASREDICGHANGVTTNCSENQGNNSWWSSDRAEDVIYERGYSRGPVRVVITMANGAPYRIKTYVGGQWRQAAGVTDIGTVSTKDATDY